MTTKLFYAHPDGWGPDASVLELSRSLGFRRCVNVSDMLFNALDPQVYDLERFRLYLDRRCVDARLVTVDVEDERANDTRAIGDALALIKARKKYAAMYTDYSRQSFTVPKDIRDVDTWASVNGYQAHDHEKDPAQDWWTNPDTGFNIRCETMCRRYPTLLWVARIHFYQDKNTPVGPEATANIVRTFRKAGGDAVVIWDEDQYRRDWLDMPLPGADNLPSVQCEFIQAVAEGAA